VSEAISSGVAGISSALSNWNCDGSAITRAIAWRPDGGPLTTPASRVERSSCWLADIAAAAAGTPAAWKSCPSCISWLVPMPAAPSWARFIAWLIAIALAGSPWRCATPTSRARFTWKLMRGRTWWAIRFLFTSA